MTQLNTVVLRCKTSNMAIDRLCKIQTYLSTKEKFSFLEEYDAIIRQHINDYKGYEEFIKIIFFNLLVVKKYTDIELSLTYEEFDELQQNNLIGLIAEKIGGDYDLMMSLVKMRDIS